MRKGGEVGMTNREAIEILGELKKCYLGGIVDAIDMAIEAVKAQEPMVMTLEEVRALDNDTPIYIQHKSGECGWDIYRGIEDDITCDIVTGSLWAEGEYWYQKEYGKSFVCWTFRPTDEQREKEPWNG